MKYKLEPGAATALAATVVSAAVAFLTAFGIFHFTNQQASALLDLAVFGAGTGALVYAWLHTWATDTYSIGQVTAGLTAAATAILGVLSAFGVFHATVEQQAALTTVSGALALAGAYVFSALHTRRTVQARRLAGTLYTGGQVGVGGGR